MRSRNDHHGLTYSPRVPWTPVYRRLVPRGGGATELYAFRDDDVPWWSDGIAIFRGAVPDYLRLDCLAEGLSVNVPHQPPFSLATLNWRGHRLGLPIATYEVSSERTPDVVPVAVFAARDLVPELHVDARYLAHAELRYTDCTFWRIAEFSCVVRDQDGEKILGYIEGRERVRRAT